MDQMTFRNLIESALNEKRGLKQVKVEETNVAGLADSRADTEVYRWKKGLEEIRPLDILLRRRSVAGGSARLWRTSPNFGP